MNEEKQKKGKLQKKKLGGGIWSLYTTLGYRGNGDAFSRKERKETPSLENEMQIESAVEKSIRRTPEKKADRSAGG